MTDHVTVIIPTLGRRAAELERAIDSVRGQIDVDALALVIVNGERYDPGLIAALQEQDGVRCHKIAAPGVSRARLEGRRLVDTPYFAFLDDDDELLENALRLRIDALEANGADVAVTNGYRDIEGLRQVIFEKFERHPDDPALALFEENWLASAGGLYRTESVEVAILDGLPNFLEMTVLALRLCERHRIVRLDEPTFVIHAGADGQASQSLAYWQALPDVLKSMQSITRRKDVLACLEQHRADALHQASVNALTHRNRLSAWRYHLNSLMTGKGLRYLPYTRHIVLGRHPT